MAPRTQPTNSRPLSTARTRRRRTSNATDVSSAGTPRTIRTPAPLVWTSDGWVVVTNEEVEYGGPPVPRSPPPETVDVPSGATASARPAATAHAKAARAKRSDRRSLASGPRTARRGRSVRIDECAASEDRRDELPVRMTSAVKCLQDRADVELDGTMFDARAIRIALDHHPAGQAEVPRQSDASGIEDTNASDVAIRWIVRVTPNDPVSVDPGQKTSDLSIGRRHVEAGSVIGPRRRMHSQEGRTVLELGGLARRELREQPEHAGLIEDPSRPCGSGRHEAIPAHKILVSHRRSRSRMGMRLLVGQHVSIRVSRDEGDVLERREHLDHLDRMRAEQDQVTERPPSLDPQSFAIIEHSAQRSGDAVNVGDDPKPHGGTVRR